MAETKHKNKVVYDGEVLIDLTADTITADKVAKGITAHDKSGALVTGTSTKDSDTTDATVAVAEMLTGKTAYARGSRITGTMPNNGAVSGNISTKAGAYTVPQGYHDGSGKVAISNAEQAKIIAGNIKSGVNILGVTGTYTGTAIKAQTKSVTHRLSVPRQYSRTADTTICRLSQWRQFHMQRAKILRAASL